MSSIFSTVSTVDLELFYHINLLPHTFLLDSFALVVHYLTFFGVILFVIFGLNLTSNIKQRKQLAMLGLISFGITFLIVEVVMKNIIMRPRPYMALENLINILPNPGGYSFPSNQTAIMFAAAVMYLLVFPKKIESYAILLFAVLTGLDRIYMGHHYPSDVLGGVIIGAVSSWGVYVYRYAILGKLNLKLRSLKKVVGSS